jgi:adenosine deaminase CECR1
LDREKALDFEFRCRAGATPLEQRVDSILRKLRQLDEELIYQEAGPRRGYGGQLHPRFPGDHFLSNTELISQTRLFNVARMMPKGAHLHIHFNACLLPHVLLDLAKKMDRMFITSSLPLLPDHDYESYDKCEIQFAILTPARENPGDIFSPSYCARQTMHFRDFLARFPAHHPGQPSPDKWLMDKLVFNEAETHDVPQTAAG